MSKLIGLVLIVAIGVGIYYVGRGVNHQASVVETVAALPNQAATTVAEANLQTAETAASTYFGENGSYAGMTTAALLAASPELSGSIQVKRADATSYCLEDNLRTSVVHLIGPGGTPTAGPCA